MAQHYFFNQCVSQYITFALIFGLTSKTKAAFGWMFTTLKLRETWEK